MVKEKTWDRKHSASFTSKIDSKGRILIPKLVRLKYRLGSGSAVSLHVAQVAQRKSDRLLTGRSQVRVLPWAPKLKKQKGQIGVD